MRKIFTALLCSFMILGLCACESDEMKSAKNAYKTEVERIETEEKELDDLISECQDYLATNPRVLFEDTITELKSSIKNAKESKQEIPEMPKEELDINEITESTLKKIEYKTLIDDVTEKEKNVKNSVKQFKQLSNPTSDFVLDRLKDVSLITGLSAITEETDPYGDLNKEKSYSGMIYFTSSLVNQDDVYISPTDSYGDIIVDKGTDGGGCIEIFTTVEDAERRNECLGSFDGTIFSSGKHVVLGTLVVRTSDLLPLSKQTELETAVINALIELK